MDLSSMFESSSPYAKAADTPDINKIMTIESVGKDTLTSPDGGEQEKVFVKFKEASKPIILSLTNGRALVGTFGADDKDWVGREVLLTTKLYQFDGKSSRGFITMPMAAKAKEVPGLNDDIPF